MKKSKQKERALVASVILKNEVLGSFLLGTFDRAYHIAKKFIEKYPEDTEWEKMESDYESIICEFAKNYPKPTDPELPGVKTHTFTPHEKRYVNLCYKHLDNEWHRIVEEFNAGSNSFSQDTIDLTRETLDTVLVSFGGTPDSTRQEEALEKGVFWDFLECVERMNIIAVNGFRISGEELSLAIDRIERQTPKA